MKDMIATVGEDKVLRIWKCEYVNQKQSKLGQELFKITFQTRFDEPVWKCGWSPVGFMLAVSTGDNVTQVFEQDKNYKGGQQQQEVGDELWVPTSEVSDKGELERPQQNQNNNNMANNALAEGQHST